MKTLATVLLLHDESHSCLLPEMLEKLGHEVVEVHSVHEVESAIYRVPDLIIIEQAVENKSPVQLLKVMKHESSPLMRQDINPLLPFVVVTQKANTDDVIDAMKLGAFDHLIMPIGLDELGSVIDRAVSRPPTPTSLTDHPSSDSLLLSQSRVMRAVGKLIGMAAATDASVLITGESGTGKDTVARTIHQHSRHKDEPLTVIDCTSIPEDYGTFQSLSDGSKGTVILDEIGDLNAQMQAMLVRALKEARLNPSGGQNADLRVIATTQYDLINMVQEKRFREDLYYRLKVVSIALPPLRERLSDILVLAETFLRQFGVQRSFSTSAAQVLLEYKWPGNVRELENLMYHLNTVLRSAVIEKSDLSMLQMPESSGEGDSESLDYYKAVSDLEKRLLTRALSEAKGSRAEAARLLGINRQLLYAKLKTHGLMDYNEETQ